jgi:hypothetical protein
VFYAQVLGHHRASIWPLHEQALARGARPHWLGQIGVENAERVATTFLERGAARLGPTRSSDDGSLVVTLRDPGGAVVALASPPPLSTPLSNDVVWHVLNTRDAERATTGYLEAFGWQLTGRVDRGAQGTFEQFAWDAGGATVGAIGDITGRPGVHPHWLFFFEVNALETAIAAARAHGGLVLDPIELPGGDRACVCDDPQGAAFALHERRPVPAVG